MFRLVVPLLLCGALTLVIGCGGTPTDACVAGLPASCTPLYEPTFDNLYDNTLHPTCAQSGASCHSTQGHMGGLVYESADESYALLLGKVDGRARVIAGNPQCSILVERIEAPDPARTMPPGKALLQAEQCAFQQWIAGGAKR